MKIGLTYDLKEAVGNARGQPDDALEEYDSIETIEAIEDALGAHGHTVVRMGGGREFLTRVVRDRVDVVFNISEGFGCQRSREAQVPSVLEMLGVPYTGSDPQCLSICLDKPLAKKLVAMAGVRTPAWQVITSNSQLEETPSERVPLPAFVKPACEGSSKGIRLGSRVESEREAVELAADLMAHYRQPVLVEEYIEGDEVTVGLVGNSPAKVLGIMRVVPRETGPGFVYSLEVKREWQNRVDYECPAQLPASTLQELADSSLKVFEALGCRDVARIDFRVTPEGVPFFLEVNPLPGLNPATSDLPIIAGKMGWSYDVLIMTILNAALERLPECVRR